MDQNAYDGLKIALFIVVFWIFYAIFGFEMAAITGLALIVALIW
jgi:hypothetical protein